MMKAWRKAVLLGVTVILAGAAAGCGTRQAVAGTVAAVAAGTSGGTESEAKAAVVRVALEEGSKPLSYEDEDGDLVGYEVDVLNAVDGLIAEYDFDVEFVSGEATTIGLDTGKYALIGGGLYRTAEREEKYLLPENPNGVSLIYIYVREDDDSIQSLDDLAGKRISPTAPNGGIYNLLTAYNEEHPDAPLEFGTSDDISTAERFTTLEQGEYDAVVIPNNLGFAEIKEQLGLHLKAVQPPVKINRTYFALAKDQKDLAEKVDAALKTLRENGTLSELNIKWYGEDTLTYLED